MGLNEDARKELGARILRLMKENKITQEQLAADIGIQRNNLHRIIYGRYNSGIDIYLKIADRLGKKIYIE